ncbi:5-(carboxyamino)imidazole ribonucleotide synthase [Enterovibrio norvegicus FF-162]|uniref:5-(carboxyamino)imidazole ribonucleotide synthase n=1 Tax=Enterovibrio norvegicus TaxID=188144 RepID=UPI0002E20272|nr:5-(carboxyamino)imidazole ribonucleotide synthase [Enterovibrio norvegicus]OEE88735.1 5-(carboxyamino)imidazole ribonucleotide synthase [Enterovibrio norvegicus FF-162]
MNVLVLGAGQLARMMALAGAPLNLKVSAYDVRSGNLVHPVTLEVLGHGLENGIAGADIITAEFEHIAPDILSICQASGKFSPGEEAILTGGDRRKEKALLDKAGVNNARYHTIQNREDFDTALSTIGVPMIVKSALDGYDGKGQWRLKSLDDIEPTWRDIAAFLQASHQGDRQCVIAEEFVPFDREVSLIGARNANGELEVYPLTENIHTDGILSVSVAAGENEALQTQAEAMFKAVADALDYVGVLAIEFFDVNGTLMVNEIAPRVHNSGHWTQQGAEVCQFENHLRAVCNLPLGSAARIRPTAMINIVGEVTVPDEVMRIAHVHWYDKAPRPGRKIGHINVCADTTAELSIILKDLTSLLAENEFPALKDAASSLSK